MSETKELHDWNVHLKGKDHPVPVLQAYLEPGPAGSDLIGFYGQGGAFVALFPQNAIAAITRSEAKE